MNNRTSKKRQLEDDQETATTEYSVDQFGYYRSGDYYWDGQAWQFYPLSGGGVGASASTTTATTTQPRNLTDLLQPAKPRAAELPAAIAAEPKKVSSSLAKSAKVTASSTTTGDDVKPAERPSSPAPLRAAGGQVWKDPTLRDWPDNDYRLFVADLGPDTQDHHLQEAFSKYKAQRVRAVRDKHKCKGYGFVSFNNVDDFTRAFREMQGKYICGRPIKLRNSQWKERQVTKTQVREIKREFQWAKKPRM